MRFAQAHAQQAGEQLRIGAIALAPGEAALPQLLAGAPGDLAGDRDAAAVDPPAELLPALGLLQQLGIPRDRRAARQSSHLDDRRLDPLRSLHAHILTPPTDIL